MPDKEKNVLEMNLEEVQAHIKKLVAKDDELSKKPTNQSGAHWHGLTTSARRKQQQLQRELQFAMRQSRDLQGIPTNDAGYSGRNTNRR